MSYDRWKTTDPGAQFLGDTHADGYDPALDGYLSFLAAIAAKRRRGDRHDWEGRKMSDIIERLRNRGGRFGSHTFDGELLHEAADEIERLRATLDWMDGVVRTSRDETLEEAARFCAEGNEKADGNYFAAGIRALKGGEQ
jgi:hypothetical protein